MAIESHDEIESDGKIRPSSAGKTPKQEFDMSIESFRPLNPC